MYYEFYLQDSDTVSRYLVYADSLDVAKEEFRVNILIEPNLKYKYSGNSYEDLRSYLHEYPNVNCYILRDGNIDPIGSPSYKSESRYIKMSNGLRKAIREAISNKEALDLYAKRDAIYKELGEIFSDSLSGLGDPKELRVRWDKLQNDLGYIDQAIKTAVSDKLGDMSMISGDEKDLFKDSKQYRVYYKKKGQDPINLPSELVSAEDEKSAETNFLSKYKNGGDVEVIKIYPIDESKSLKEAEQSFTVEYREDGKTKYSSVKANSESEALNKFRDITKDRNVSGAKIAATDVSDEGTLTEATIEDYDALENQCRSDLSDILDGREFWTRVDDMEEYLAERGYHLLDTGNFPESIEIEDGDGNQFTLNVNSAGEGRSFTVYFGECSFINESKKFRESMGDIIDLHTMTREEFDRLPYGRSFMSNRASISVDGKEYVKLSPDTWQYLPTVTHALGYKVSVDEMWDIIQKGKSAQMVESKKIKEAGGPSTWKGLDTGDKRLDTSISMIFKVTNRLIADTRDHDMFEVQQDLITLRDYVSQSLRYIEESRLTDSTKVSVREGIRSVFKKK